MKQFILLLFLCPLALFAQPGHEEMKERIKAEKVAFITQELELTSKEAQTFWPLYNEYEAKIDALRKKIHASKRKLKDYKTLSEKEQKEKLNAIFKYEEEEAALKKEYFAKFDKILSTQKAVGVFVAEEKFKRHLLHKLKEHRRRE